MFGSYPPPHIVTLAFDENTHNKKTWRIVRNKDDTAIYITCPYFTGSAKNGEIDTGSGQGQGKARGRVWIYYLKDVYDHQELIHNQGDLNQFYKNKD